MLRGCANCFLKRYAERRPHSWLARLWRWHTGWCPGWQNYLKQQAEAETKAHADYRG